MGGFIGGLALVAGLSAPAAAGRSGQEPEFGPSVLVFDPATPDLQARINRVFAEQEASQFGSGRYALLFKPGTYDLDVRVGFYTHVAGLGVMPGDVRIRGAVRATAEWMKGNATCNFWRCAENLTIEPPDRGVNVWATSQAVSLRRVHVKGDLRLSDGGWSSGGFIADCIIDGTVDSGSQQQWFSRNTGWGAWRGGNWNMVFVGVSRPPEGEWPEKPYTVIERAPVTREKPYLYIDDSGRYFVRRPGLRSDSIGPSWSPGAGPGAAGQDGDLSIPLEACFIARADRDGAATINAALARGQHLILTPGIYRLGAPIRVERAGTVVLGLGYPTLVATGGVEAIVVEDVPGVSIAGVLLEAGEQESPVLARIGRTRIDRARTGRTEGEDRTFLFDVFARAGGAAPGSASCFLKIESSRVVGDNLWLWRADHGAGAAWNVSRNRNGLIVNGNDVVMYGLFVEHCQEYQTIWNGERGRVYFYQSEMPYDPPSVEAWSHDGVAGYASYKVGPGVVEHEAWGLGVYCVFRAAPIVAHTAIEAPIGAGVRLHHLVTIRLSGIEGSGIAHIVNNEGDAVVHKKKATRD
jgi:hypothetical protein